MFKKLNSTLMLPCACALLAVLFCSLMSSIGGRREARAPAASAITDQTVAPGDSIQAASEPPVEGSVLTESFSTSPVEWRPAGAAVIEVTNRWQCDPRWTFFSLRNDRIVGKSAALWSKRFYTGDVTVEFYFAIKMDRERGDAYRYARDINVTIGSDGSDLRKGCTFSLGGYNNSCSFISRDGTELRRVPVKIPSTGDNHHHWYKFRAERKSGRLTFQVDRLFESASDAGAEITVDDPLPMSGNRIAIWTYDNAIMLSKVRISGEGGIETESPDFVAKPLTTIYGK